MIRIATLAALLVVASPAAAQTSDNDASSRPVLKSAVTVSDAIVHIGDLVENAGAVADVPIFRAPDLGQTGSVPADRVIEAVRPHHLLGVDSRGLTEIQVTRASRTISGKEIEARVVGALAGQYGLPDAASLSVTFDNPVRTLQVEPSITGELVIARMNFEQRTNRFDVTFELPGSPAGRRLPMRYTGALTETVEVVVATREIAQNEVLKASDLALERRPKSQSTASTLTKITQAQELSPRHSLRSGQVIRQTDLTKPELVGRGETVTLVYEAPGIRLTMRGKAIEPGTLGDVINVLNVDSKRTIQATVVGPGRVGVNGGTSRLATSATP